MSPAFPPESSGPFTKARRVVRAGFMAAGPAHCAGGGTSNGAGPAAATPRGAAGKVTIDCRWSRPTAAAGCFLLARSSGLTQRLPALWLMSAVEGKPEVAGARSK
jgi:hypothetical protein